MAALNDPVYQGQTPYQGVYGDWFIDTADGTISVPAPSASAPAQTSQWVASPNTASPYGIQQPTADIYQGQTPYQGAWGDWFIDNPDGSGPISVPAPAPSGSKAIGMVDIGGMKMLYQTPDGSYWYNGAKVDWTPDYVQRAIGNTQQNFDLVQSQKDAAMAAQQDTTTGLVAAAAGAGLGALGAFPSLTNLLGSLSPTDIATMNEMGGLGSAGTIGVPGAVPAVPVDVSSTLAELGGMGGVPAAPTTSLSEALGIPQATSIPSLMSRISSAAEGASTPTLVDASGLPSAASAAGGGPSDAALRLAAAGLPAGAAITNAINTGTTFVPPVTPSGTTASIPGLPGVSTGGSSGGPGGAPAGSTSGFDLSSLAGLSALIPGLAMIGSAKAQKPLDTSNLTAIADTLRSKSALPGPDTSALSGIASTLSGKAAKDVVDTSGLTDIASQLKTQAGQVAPDTSSLDALASAFTTKAGTETPDMTGLQNLAAQFQTKAGTETPDLTGLQDIVTKLSGPDSLQALLTAQARGLIPSVTAGNLPAGAQTLVSNALNDELNSIRSKYAQMGLSGSTMQSQEEASAKARSMAASFGLEQQLTQLGLTEAGAATQDLTAAAGVQGQIINAKLAASGLSSQDLSNAASIQQAIMSGKLQASNLTSQDLSNAASIQQAIMQGKLQAAGLSAQELAQAANISSTAINEQLQASGLQSADLASAANIQANIVNAGLQAAGLSTTQLADAASIYNQILQEQLAQDTALQQALANFASASAIGIGLAASGGKGGTTTPGVGSVLSNIGGGFTSFLNSILPGGGGATTTDITSGAATA